MTINLTHQTDCVLLDLRNTAIAQNDKVNLGLINDELYRRYTVRMNTADNAGYDDTPPAGYEVVRSGRQVWQ